MTVALADAVARGCRKVVGVDGRRGELLAVFKRHFKIECEVVKGILLRSDLQGCCPNPKFHLRRPPFMEVELYLLTEVLERDLADAFLGQALWDDDG